MVIQKPCDYLMTDLKNFDLPEVPLVGVFRARAATPGLVDHIHQGLMEICYLKSGQMIFQVQGRDYVMSGNEVFVTWPDEIHSSGKHPQGRGLLYWMQIQLPSRYRNFLGLAPLHANPLITRLRHLPHRHFNGRRELASLFNRIVRTLNTNTGEMKSTLLANTIVQWLLMVIDCSNRPINRIVSDDVQAVLKHIDRHLTDPISLGELANVASLSTSRMKARFKDELGMPPHEYILRCRIDRAITLLSAGNKSVTDIAYDLGFSSSQYFATVFKRFTHENPSHFIHHS
jgi:AraC-like DNA-binding protein